VETLYTCNPGPAEVIVLLDHIGRLLDHGLVLYVSCYIDRALSDRPVYRERKCADTIGTVPVPWAGRHHSPVLKYQYIFQIKYTEAIFIKQRALGNCYGLKLPKCRLRFKKTILLCHLLQFSAHFRALYGWLGSRVVSVLDSGAEGPGFKSQLRRCRVTVLGKLFTPIVPLFAKQRNW